MTIVIADTSPLNYLTLIGEIGILPRLYGKIVVPSEVLAELLERGSPPEVEAWALSRPEWLEVRAVSVSVNDVLLERIDPGERAAILLAQAERDVLLLIDDSAGRAEAKKRGIPTTGTLGVLRTAAGRGLLDLSSALTKLATTNFRVSKALLDDLGAEDLARRHPGTNRPSSD